MNSPSSIPSNSSTKVLVTGANGFVGAYVVQQLKQNFDVVALVRTGKEVQGVKNYTFQSLTDPNLEKAMEGATVVVHIASQLHGPLPEMMAANVDFTKRLVDLAKEKRVRQFIYISTENVTQGNQDIYSKTKALAEEEVKAFSPHVILRPTIVYGPGDKKYIGRLMSIIKKFPLVPVLGNGKNKFQFIFVKDVADIIESSIRKNISGTFTIAGPEITNYNELMQVLMETMQNKKRLLHLPIWLLKPAAMVLNVLFKSPPLTPTQLDNLKLDRTHDISNVVAVFDYQPTSLKTGLQKTLQSL